MNKFIEDCHDLEKMTTLYKASLPDSNDYYNEDGTIDASRVFRLKYADEEVYHLDKICASINKIWRNKPQKCNQKECLFRQIIKADYSPKQFKTVDALKIGRDGRYYFIEFKAQSLDNIGDKNRDWHILGKAIESLFCASLTVLNEKPMKEISEKAAFILVYKRMSTTKPSSPSANEIISEISERANRKDEFGIEIYFGLQQLKSDYRLYNRVHTWSEEEFNTLCGTIFDVSCESNESA